VNIEDVAHNTRKKFLRMGASAGEVAGFSGRRSLSI
jgi:hypothetical protein